MISLDAVVRELLKGADLHQDVEMDDRARKGLFLAKEQILEAGPTGILLEYLERVQIRIENLHERWLVGELSFDELMGTRPIFFMVERVIRAVRSAGPKLTLEDVAEACKPDWSEPIIVPRPFPIEEDPGPDEMLPLPDLADVGPDEAATRVLSCLRNADVACLPASTLLDRGREWLLLDEADSWGQCPNVLELSLREDGIWSGRDACRVKTGDALVSIAEQLTCALRKALPDEPLRPTGISLEIDIEEDREHCRAPKEYLSAFCTLYGPSACVYLLTEAFPLGLERKRAPSRSFTLLSGASRLWHTGVPAAVYSFKSRRFDRRVMLNVRFERTDHGLPDWSDEIGRRMSGRRACLVEEWLCEGMAVLPSPLGADRNSRRLLESCREGPASLWLAARLLEMEWGAAYAQSSTSEKIATTLTPLADLLFAGLIRFGDKGLGASRFQPWNLPPAEAILKIGRDWAAGKESPGLAAIAWYEITEQGLEVLGSA